MSFLNRCPGRPAVEITKLVNIDEKTGEIEIPAAARYAISFRVHPFSDVHPFPYGSENLPKAKPWRDVTRYHPDVLL
jgi:hypothetical protein